MRPLNADEIEVRVGQVFDQKASMLLYKNARVDMTILDETYGEFGWMCDYKEVKGNMYCGISTSRFITSSASINLLSLFCHLSFSDSGHNSAPEPLLSQLFQQILQVQNIICLPCFTSYNMPSKMSSFSLLGFIPDCFSHVLIHAFQSATG